MSADRRHANVVNVDEVQPVQREQGSRFGLEYRNLCMSTLVTTDVVGYTDSQVDYWYGENTDQTQSS